MTDNTTPIRMHSQSVKCSSSYLNSQYFFDLSLQTSLPEVCYSEVVQDDAGLWKYVYPHKQELISLV